MQSRLVAITEELGISSALLAARGLPECEEAGCLEVAEHGLDGRDHLLVATAAEAWRTLKAAALRDGVSLYIVSAFRSIERQAEIIRRKLNAGAAIEEILTVCAPPGFSEHHTGRAVDISTADSPALEVEFDETPAFAWLLEHANDFSFYLSYPAGNSLGYQYEPWHWCFQDTQPCGQADLERCTPPSSGAVTNG
jgi:zinc D-Ala-D-Ala carboxypeptidase